MLCALGVPGTAHNATLPAKMAQYVFGGMMGLVYNAIPLHSVCYAPLIATSTSLTLVEVEGIVAALVCEGLLEHSHLGVRRTLIPRAAWDRITAAAAH